LWTWTRITKCYFGKADHLHAIERIFAFGLVQNRPLLLYWLCPVERQLDSIGISILDTDEHRFSNL
jgi:hypothetical protein